MTNSIFKSAKTLAAAGMIAALTSAPAPATAAPLPDRNDGEVAAAALLLLGAMLLSGALTGGAAASTKGVDERMSRDKGKLLDRF